MSEVRGYFKTQQPMDRRAYISRSKLDLAIQGLEFFFATYGEGISTPSTPGQIEGQRLHRAVLEPEEWRRNRFVHRFADMRSPEAKDWVKRIERENPGALILSPQDDLRYARIADRVLSHRMAGNLIKRARTELHGYATCPRTGALLYSRPDIITPEGWIGDLKFCRNVDAQDFNREQERSRYFMQLAFYNYVHSLIEGVQLSGNCFWIAVEIYYPHRLRVYTMHADFEKMGNCLWNGAMDKILACLGADPQMKNYEVWRAESNGASELSPELWMANKDPRFMDAIAVGG